MEQFYIYCNNILEAKESIFKKLILKIKKNLELLLNVYLKALAS